MLDVGAWCQRAAWEQRRVPKNLTTSLVWTGGGGEGRRGAREQCTMAGDGGGGGGGGGRRGGAGRQAGGRRRGWAREAGEMVGTLPGTTKVHRFHHWKRTALQKTEKGKAGMFLDLCNRGVKLTRCGGLKNLWSGGWTWARKRGGASLGTPGYA